MCGGKVAVFLLFIFLSLGGAAFTVFLKVFFKINFIGNDLENDYNNNIFKVIIY